MMAPHRVGYLLLVCLCDMPDDALLIALSLTHTYSRTHIHTLPCRANCIGEADDIYQQCTERCLRGRPFVSGAAIAPASSGAIDNMHGASAVDVSTSDKPPPSMASILGICPTWGHSVCHTLVWQWLDKCVGPTR